MSKRRPPPKKQRRKPKPVRVQPEDPIVALGLTDQTNAAAVADRLKTTFDDVYYERTTAEMAALYNRLGIEHNERLRRNK